MSDAREALEAARAELEMVNFRLAAAHADFQRQNATIDVLETGHEYLVGRSWGVDVLLPRIDLGGVAPRMAPASALALSLLGVAVVAGGLGRARVMRGLAVAAFGVGQVAILGYAYGVSALYTVGGATSMALHTALGIAALSLAILLHDPSAGLVGLLRDQGSAGKLLRPIAPLLVLGPSVLGGVRLWAQDQGWFDTRFGVGVLVMSMTVLGGALSWRAAVKLRVLDRARDSAARALDETNRTLEATVSERTRELARRQSFTDALLETVEVGIVSCDADGNYLVRNQAQRAMVGQDQDSRVQPGLEPEPFDILDSNGRQLAVEQFPMMRTLRGETLGPVDLRLGPPGGPHREVVARGSQILAADGAVLGAVVSLADVTAERTASRALDAEHRKPPRRNGSATASLVRRRTSVASSSSSAAARSMLKSWLTSRRNASARPSVASRSDSSAALRASNATSAAAVACSTRRSCSLSRVLRRRAAGPRPAPGLRSEGTPRLCRPVSVWRASTSLETRRVRGSRC